MRTKTITTRAPKTLGDTRVDVQHMLGDVRRALCELKEAKEDGPFDPNRVAREARDVLELIQETNVRELATQKSVTHALRSLAAELERRVAPETPKTPALLVATDEFAVTTERCLTLLRDAMRHSPPRIAPSLDRAAALGHTYPFACDRLETDAAGAIATLEELADLGLLQRTLANRVHTCPTCEHCQVNFREQCTRCRSIDLSIERVLHHFRCGYTGIESAFQSGTDLVCPKCRHGLRQLGQDFDRPHETYVCRDCTTLFEEPQLSGQCLECSSEFDAKEAPQRAIHAYVPTPLAIRAVELGRLTGLDVDSILYDAELKIATRDFMDFEIKRELVRLGRTSDAFTTAVLSFESAGRAVPIFQDWSAAAVRELCIKLADSLRLLDLVTRLDTARIGILMPSADVAGANVVRERLFSLLEGLHFADPAGNAVTPVWRVATWSSKEVRIEDVRTFLRPVGPR